MREDDHLCCYGNQRTDASMYPCIKVSLDLQFMFSRACSRHHSISFLLQQSNQ
jgi:hypothetical protein